MQSSSNIDASRIVRPGYRPDIDGLRAIAVCCVLVCHALPSWLPGGFVGVDVFFVISGYLITGILMDEVENGRFSVLRFYDRRIRRIFPALVVVAAATISAGWFVLFRPEFESLGRHAVSSVVFAENFMLWSESGYFDATSLGKPFLHLWSLAVEEQFYILWPLLIVLLHRRRIGRVPVVLLVGLASFLVNLHDIGSDTAAAYYSPAGRFWELMVGSMLACLRSRNRGQAARHGDAMSLAGLGLVAAAVALVDPDRNFPGFWALLPTTGAFLLIWAGPSSWVNRNLLSRRPLVLCGLISYPLYLWHWPIISYYHIVFGQISIPAAALLIAASVLAAWLTYAYVEAPFRKRSGGTLGPAPLVAAMTIVLCIGMSMTMSILPPRLRQFDAPVRNEWDFLKDRVGDFDANGNGEYALHADRSHLTLFVGDSHVAQYAERIDRTIGADEDRQGAVMVVGGGCIPITGVYTVDPSRRGCAELIERAFASAREDRFSTVVIGGAWNWYLVNGPYLMDVDGRPVGIHVPQARMAALASLEDELRSLVRSGKGTILVLDNSIWSDFGSALRSIRMGPASDFELVPRLGTIPEQDALKDEMAALAMRAGAETVDPNATLCNDGACPVVGADGIPIYKDAGHLNPEWAVDNAAFIDTTTEKVRGR